MIVVVAALLIAAIVGSPAIDLLPNGSLARPSLEGGLPTPPTPNSPGELRWRHVKGADFYNVVIWRAGTRVLDLWPRTNHVRPDASGRRGRLAAGEYLWFAYPGFVEKARTRYGRLAGSGSFRVSGTS